LWGRWGDVERSDELNPYWMVIWLDYQPVLGVDNWSGKFDFVMRVFVLCFVIGGGGVLGELLAYFAVAPILGLLVPSMT